MDREKVIKGLELLKDFLCDGLPGKRVVFNSYIGIVNDAISLLKEQEEYVPLEPVVMYLSHYACPPEMYPGIHTPEEERELWRKTLKSIK